MPTIEQRKSLRISQAIGPQWSGTPQEGRYWIFEPSTIDGVPGMHVRPDGETQPTAWWYDTREEVDAAVKLYDQKHRSLERRKALISENGLSSAPMHDIVPRPVLYWVLVGHWEGSPFPIMRGQPPPPLSVWSVTDREQWERLRSENYYTRRSKSRPVAKVDREFQKQTGKDVWED